MKKLYSFSWDCGRSGTVESVFVADDKEIIESIGKQVYFGEILGKHSEIYGTLDEEDLTVESEDQEFIAKILDTFGNTVSGYNPFDYMAEEDEEDEEDEKED